MNKDINLTNHISKVFGVMSLGLIVSAVTGYLSLQSIVNRGFLYNFIMNQGSFLALVIIQVVLVIAIGAFIGKINSIVAGVLFFVYSVVTGLTLSILPLAYGIGDIFMAFGLAAIFFIVMAIVGKTTELDISNTRGVLIGGLLTLIIVGFINYFVKSEFISTIVPYFGVIVFMGLTAYDVQKIKTNYELTADNQEMRKKMIILGALELYLDFINVFLFILRILGGKRR